MSLPLFEALPGNGAHVHDGGEQSLRSPELIRLEHITKTYVLGEVDVPVLKGVSLTIARGEMVALMALLVPARPR